MSQRYYNASIRNLEYRLRRFKERLPEFLEDIIYEVEEIIVSAIADDQLYRRGVTGKDVKIASYAPYAETTKRIKRILGQPTTRVTLKDTGDFHGAMRVVFDDEYPGGFYVTSDDEKVQMLVEKYGPEIFRLTNKNFTRIVNIHIRRRLQKRLQQELRKQ